MDELRQEGRKIEWLKQERIILYLFIAISIIFLISSPATTGAAVAESGGKTSNYLLAVIILIVILILVTLIFHFLGKRETRYEAPSSLEEKIPLYSMRKKIPLSDKLEQVNEEIYGLAEDIPAPPKIFKKLTRISSLEEKKLEQELNKITSKLKKPTVLEAPSRNKKLDSSRTYVEKELAELKSKEFKKVKFREEMPSARKLLELKEKERMKKEMEEISSTLKEKKPGFSLLPRGLFLNRKKQEQKKKIKEQIKDDLPKTELDEIEEKLSELKKAS